MPKVPAHPVCEVVACEVCLREIPRDLAKSEEATEYVHYFCGESCYARWQAGEDGSGTEGTRPPR